jgi:[ribosomal protein S18]-alanine N-acetyltransferase
MALPALVVAPMIAVEIPAAVAIDLASFPPSELGTDPESVRTKQLTEELDRSWGRVRAARVDGVLVGYVLFWHVTDEIHLLNVAVAPSERRKGIGRRLVEEVLAYAKDSAARKVLLEVRESNAPAIALYERLGFVRFNVRSRYYADGEDGIEMMFELP